MTESEPTKPGIEMVTDRSFESEVEKSAKPVVVMFFSDTCPHCRTILPYIEEFARDLGERVRFARIDIAVNPWTIERFGVLSTPTFKFFCNGRPVQELVGAVYPAVIRRLIEELEVRGPECARNSTEITYDITGYG
jgi:thioredoxin-like negative regulator of GroEL